MPGRPQGLNMLNKLFEEKLHSIPYLYELEDLTGRGSKVYHCLTLTTLSGVDATQILESGVKKKSSFVSFAYLCRCSTVKQQSFTRDFTSAIV